jgi:hypothetical protein
MHYHPIPQMPGDYWILCEDHVSSDPEVYPCDCPNNQCYACEEESPTPEEWLATLRAYCEKLRRSSTYGKHNSEGFGTDPKSDMESV